MKRISRPTLLVDEEQVRRNIQQMLEKARKNELTLRPHFKTHQSAAIGEWFLDAGVDKATVSSVQMARYFADAGWKDLTLALPYNPREADQIADLARKITLNVLVESAPALDHLHQHVDADIGYFIEIDTGDLRTGVSPADEQQLQALSQSRRENHVLKGLLTHAGHAYQAMDRQQAAELFQHCVSALTRAREATGRQDLLLSYGDTPVCSLLQEFAGIDELRPGNFVFYDLMQYAFGACRMEDIAVCLACPVISLHPERNEAVVYGGAVHLSKDYLQENDRQNNGEVVMLTAGGWEVEHLAKVTRLSQEHGIIRGTPAFIRSLSVGDLVGILPVHACLTAHLQPSYLSLGGELLAKFNIAAI